MKSIKYRRFSREFHARNQLRNNRNVCQFELTFACSLHCRHCDTDCYNKKEYIRKELSTKEVKFILDQVYKQGVLWLCFTGGDPLMRKDFLELYAYAKNKGFITTIFTNAYSMNKKIARDLKKRPPFLIEITLNAAGEDLYERIARVEGSYQKVMRGLGYILKAGLPLKINTQIMKDNLGHLQSIKDFTQKCGKRFRPVAFLHNRLNGDPVVKNLRISPREVLALRGNNRLSDNCAPPKRRLPQRSLRLFTCVIGKGGIYVDPYGNLVPCKCIRNPKFNLLRMNIADACVELENWVNTCYLDPRSACAKCLIRNLCYNCPGKAVLETGSLKGRASWYCELAYLSQQGLGG